MSVIKFDTSMTANCSYSDGKTRNKRRQSLLSQTYTVPPPVSLTAVANMNALVKED